jgi:hypothetical protein
MQVAANFVTVYLVLNVDQQFFAPASDAFNTDPNSPKINQFQNL